MSNRFLVGSFILALTGVTAAVQYYCADIPDGDTKELLEIISTENAEREDLKEISQDELESGSTSQQQDLKNGESRGTDSIKTDDTEKKVEVSSSASDAAVRENADGGKSETAAGSVQETAETQQGDSAEKDSLTGAGNTGGSAGSQNTAADSRTGADPAGEYFKEAEEMEAAGRFTDAALLYMKATELNHPEAPNSLGILYLQGAGVEEDYTKARLLFEEALRRGSKEVYKSLGFIYKTGRGVPIDSDRALIYFMKPAQEGDAMSQNEIGTIYQSKSNDEAYRQAALWYEKAAEQDYDPALYNLALLYKEGKGVSRDPVRSVSLLRRAAEHGHAYAQHDLAAAYAAGEGVEKDMIQMYAWFTVAGHAIQASLDYRSMLGSLMTEEERARGEAAGEEYFGLYGSHE